MDSKTKGHNRTITLERVADCPFGFSIEHADALFITLQTDGVRLQLPGLFGTRGSLSRPVQLSFEHRFDQTEVGRLHDEITFNWNARTRWLPELNGVFRFRIEYSRTRLIFVADYAIPFGFFGVAFDEVIGRRIASATAHDILDRLAVLLETQWKAFSATLAPKNGDQRHGDSASVPSKTLRQ